MELAGKKINVRERAEEASPVSHSRAMMFLTDAEGGGDAEMLAFNVLILYK